MGSSDSLGVESWTVNVTSVTEKYFLSFWAVRCQLSGTKYNNRFSRDWVWVQLRNLYNAPFKWYYRCCCLLLKASALLHLSKSMHTYTHIHTQRMSLFSYRCRCLDTHHLPPQQHRRVKRRVSLWKLALYPANPTPPSAPSHQKKKKPARNLQGFTQMSIRLPPIADALWWSTGWITA